MSVKVATPVSAVAVALVAGDVPAVSEFEVKSVWYDADPSQTKGLRGVNPEQINWDSGRPSTAGFPPPINLARARSATSPPLRRGPATTLSAFSGRLVPAQRPTVLSARR
jgi:hypothetical protein